MWTDTIIKPSARTRICRFGIPALNTRAFKAPFGLGAVLNVHGLANVKFQVAQKGSTEPWSLLPGLTGLALICCCYAIWPHLTNSHLKSSISRNVHELQWHCCCLVEIRSLNRYACLGSRQRLYQGAPSGTHALLLIHGYSYLALDVFACRFPPISDDDVPLPHDSMCIQSLREHHPKTLLLTYLELPGRKVAPPVSTNVSHDVQ